MATQPDSANNGKFSTDTEPDMNPGNVTTDFPRWGELGLQDPRRDGALPDNASVADILAWAMVKRGATCPVEGILEGVANDHLAVAHLLDRGARRIQAAIHLMRIADGRAAVTVTEEEQRAEALREE